MRHAIVQMGPQLDSTPVAVLFMNSPRVDTQPVAVDTDVSQAQAARAVTLVEAVRARNEAERSGPVPAAVPVELAQEMLATRLRAHVERASIEVQLTDNRYTMISVRRAPKDRRYQVRLHLMFADADPVITRALARYITDNCKTSSRVLGRFIDANSECVKGLAKRAPKQILVTSGEVHDLRDIFDTVNESYFGGRIQAAITWGPRTQAVRRRNSIKMGSYVLEDRLIRVHRALDRGFVPRYFVEWVVYHEMLHQVHGVAVKNGRREFHSPAFLADEQRFAQFAQAKAFERAHIDALLTY